MKSKKQLKIGENVKRIMSNIFLRQDLSIIEGSLVTILEADISPDCTSAKIFIDILGQKENEKKVLKKLNDLKVEIRFKLAQEANLRIAPELSFIHDKTSEHVSKINSLIEGEADFYAHKTLTKSFEQKPDDSKAFKNKK